MTTLTHSDIKRIKSLAQKKFRDETGLFVVEGEKMVEEALRSSFVVEEVYRIEDIGADIMARITQFSTPSPVLALVRRPSGIRLETPEDVERAIGSKGLYLALDGIRDPGNLGTILRVADWFGLDGVLASDDTVELLNESGSGHDGGFVPGEIPVLRPAFRLSGSRFRRRQGLRNLP